MWEPILREFETLATTGVAGYRYFLLMAKGDLEIRANCWGLPHHNSSSPCSECWCNRSTVPFTDLGSSAGWRAYGELSRAQFLGRCRHPAHPLVTSQFAWRYFFPVDMMHVVDCNGLTGIIASSVLRVLIQRDNRLGRNQAARLATINTLLDDYYARNPGISKMPPLRLQNFVDGGGWYRLHGKTVKSASTRALSPFLVEVAELYYAELPDGHPRALYNRLVLRAVRGLARFYEMLYKECHVVLQDRELSELKRVVQRLLIAVQELRDLSRQDGVLAWGVVPKTHYFAHLPTLASYVNPRYCQNYHEEGHVGVSTRIWARSANGRYRGTIQKTFLMKRLTSIFLRLEELSLADAHLRVQA